MFCFPVAVFILRPCWCLFSAFMSPVQLSFLLCYWKPGSQRRCVNVCQRVFVCARVPSTKPGYALHLLFQKVSHSSQFPGWMFYVFPSLHLWLNVSDSYHSYSVRRRFCSISPEPSFFQCASQYHVYSKQLERGRPFHRSHAGTSSRRIKKCSSNEQLLAAVAALMCSVR